jgi:hypothetical protein
LGELAAGVMRKTTKWFSALALAAGVGSSCLAADLDTVCQDQTSGTVRGTTAAGMNACAIIDDTGTISAGVYASGVPGVLTVFTNLSTTYGVTAPQAQATFISAISLIDSTYTVSASAYGFTGTPTTTPPVMGGLTILTIMSGPKIQMRLASATEVGVNRSVTLRIPAGAVVQVNILSIGNAQGTVDFIALGGA